MSEPANQTDIICIVKNKDGFHAVLFKGVALFQNKDCVRLNYADRHKQVAKSHKGGLNLAKQLKARHKISDSNIYKKEALEIDSFSSVSIFIRNWNLGSTLETSIEEWKDRVKQSRLIA